MTDLIEVQTAACKPSTKQPRKMARDAEAATFAPTEPRVNKSDLVVELLQRPSGATLNEMIAVTGWLPHTTRAVSACTGSPAGFTNSWRCGAAAGDQGHR